MATVFTHTVGITYHTDAGTIATTTDSYTGDAEESFTGILAQSTSNQAIALGLTVANIKSLIFFSTQDATIKTNSASAPVHTINLKANKQVVWNTDSTMTSPVATTNVTQIFASCTNTATLQMRFLLSA